MSATKIKVFTAVFYVWNTFPLHIYQLLNIFYKTYSKFKLFKKKYIQMSRLRRQTCGVMIEDPKWKHCLWCKWALFKVRRIQQERRMAYTETIVVTSSDWMSWSIWFWRWNDMFSIKVCNHIRISQKCLYKLLEVIWSVSWDQTKQKSPLIPSHWKLYLRQ